MWCRAYMCSRPRAGSDLAMAASFPKPSKPCHGATFMHRLVKTFVCVADQVDLAVTSAAIGTGIDWLQPDHFVVTYGFRVLVLLCGIENRMGICVLTRQRP